MESNMLYNKFYQMMADEISTIESDDVRKFAISLLNSIPEYFFTVPASSSGKYHPKNDLGEGGLVRHSISVKRMLIHLLEPNGYYEFTEREKDLLIVAALFHDSFKSGTQEEYEKNNQTKFLHPAYAASYIIMQSVIHSFDYKDAKFISSAIISHMGQWNKNRSNLGTLPTPETPEQKILHLADYLASRKDINMTITDEDEETEIVSEENNSNTVITNVQVNQKTNL